MGDRRKNLYVLRNIIETREYYRCDLPDHFAIKTQNEGPPCYKGALGAAAPNDFLTPAATA